MFNKAFNTRYHTNLKDYVLNTFNINLFAVKESYVAAKIYEERSNKLIPEVLKMINQPVLMDEFNVDDIPTFDTIENIDLHYVIQANFKNAPIAVIYKKYKKYDTIHMSSILRGLPHVKPLWDENSHDDFEIITLGIFEESKQAEQYREKIWKELKEQGYQLLNSIDKVYCNSNAKKGKFANKALFIPDFEYDKSFCLKQIQNRWHKIKCTTTNTIFRCMRDACTAANVSKHMVLAAIKNKSTAGEFQDGTRLKWEYA